MKCRAIHSYVLLLFFTLLASCEVSNEFVVLNKDGLTACQVNVIEKLHNECTQKCNCGCSNAQLISFELNNKSYFYWSNGQNNPDEGAPVYDANCNSIGLLGGYAGNTKIEGTDMSEAINQKVLWSAP